MVDLKQLNGSKIAIELKLDDRLIDGAVVKPLSFTSYIECIEEARALKDPKTWEGRLRRARMLRQVDYYTNGAVAKITGLELVKLTIPSARAIASKLDESDGVQGKIIREGDGIDKAIVYELGKPIPVQGKEPIRELEFLAKNYGDVEDIMATVDSLQQVNLLIANLAKPLGTSLTLLPSWALAHITVTDGFTIMQQVLPPFLGLPVES
jgi:hypothetical protein